MSPIPPLPNWSALHPLITHIPIALLSLSPIALLAGALTRNKVSKVFLITTLFLLVLGTAMLPVALHTGRTSATAGNLLPEMNSILDEHRALARYTTSAMVTATVLFALTLFTRMALRLPDNSMISAVLPVAFLIFYSIGMFQLLSTATHGAQMVHGHAFNESVTGGHIKEVVQ